MKQRDKNEMRSSYPGTGPSVVMIGFKPSFFLFLFRSVGLPRFPAVEFVPLPFAPAIKGIVVEGDNGLTPGRVEDGSVSFAPFIVSNAVGKYIKQYAVAN